jgi:hypothetical protein
MRKVFGIESPASVSTSTHALPRRVMLKSAGVAMALPFLDAMLPPLARAAQSEPPMRMFCICNNLSMIPEYFFPADSGRDYTPSPYLELIQEHRQDFTVFSGVSHPGVVGGHPTQPSFLTAAPGPNSPSFRNSISIDQVAAEHIGSAVRYPVLALGVNAASSSISFTASGVAIPSEDRPSALFAELFLQGSQAEVAEQIRRVDEGRSILDTVTRQARRMESRISTRDRERMDQYFTSVRDLEQRFRASREWMLKPKPSVDAKMPKDFESPANYLEKTQLMFDMARLAFETDSTRLVTLLLNSATTPTVSIEGKPLKDSYHNLSHHGQSPEKLDQLKQIEGGQMKALGKLMADLKAVQEANSHMLDRTMVLFGSNMGSASKHTSDNMPILLAGGGFKHGQHLAFDKQNNYPLPNLYLSMLQRMGVEKDRFSTSTGTMRGLEVRA